ncbi:hypothetical protein EMIHUDRAFT_195064 [Emiliania huxleyi CCMP1516]|uniref:Methyltransferase domain-containing protein n=2 Tax=Emiliania huxleyi TaxID=2903 RepID=A0A0D3JGU8_EMIH1|nr:hypothetical protein EMIHUDRAFT_195064 [Emiliania huxleyi CCMP1516]EOD22733.1 hypothetical protein EMIHUDRAFT_195064 [Emiliania huxleyi CCMP1516]|eukprot:XP_005775162.1 hypothetical protein EMIHUDRAFT_195064 [Emiliania huxleyi CCMP1516]
MALAGSDVLAESWTSAAPGYDELFVPRFAPWTEDALAALTQHKHSLPEDHEVLVPCCGPGQELLPIAELLGGERAVRGTDLAPGMIEIAQSRCVAAAARFGRMSAEVGDAMAPGAGPYAAIFSVFGLQQLPDPVAAIEAWVRALAPGGVAVVCYWPMGAGERRHRIEWPCPAGMWEGMTRSGPWHAQRVRRGDAFVDGLRDDFLAPVKTSLLYYT